jgi:Metallo-beta-lactamase superfamily
MAGLDPAISSGRSVLVRACLLRCSRHLGEDAAVQQIKIGDVTIDAVIEREGPWRRPQDFFPAYDDATFKRHLEVMEPEVFDPASGMMFITYQTFVVRTPRHTILVDTCTGEDKGHPPPFDFPGKERWRKELFALGVSYDKIDYVFCTHLHIDHTGCTPGNTRRGRRNTRAAPILPARCSVTTACRSWKPGRPCSWLTTTLWMTPSR